MQKTLIPAGFHSFVAFDKVVAVAVPSSAPVKHNIQEARGEGRVIDLTCGRKTKSVVYTDDSYLILSAIEPATLQSRLICAQEGNNGENSI